MREYINFKKKNTIWRKEGHRERKGKKEDAYLDTSTLTLRQEPSSILQTRIVLSPEDDITTRSVGENRTDHIPRRCPEQTHCRCR